MTRKKMLLFASMFLLVAFLARADEPPFSSEEVANLKKVSNYYTSWNIFLNVWALLGPVLAALTTWLFLKKRVSDWAEQEITKKATEKIGADWNIVKMLVNEKSTQINKRKDVKIAIVNYSTGERKELESVISGLQYPKPVFFAIQQTTDNSIKSFGNDFKKGDFDFLIVDNEDEKITEDAVKKILDDNFVAFGSKMIWYTKTDTRHYQELSKKGIGFVKLSSRFQLELDNRLPVS